MKLYQLAATIAVISLAMLILTEPQDATRIADPAIRALVTLRFHQLGHFHDGQLIVVEVGDGVEELEAVSGIPLLRDPFEDVPFGHPDFTPSFDYIEAHYANGRIYCFEAHADTSNDGPGITLFVPSEEGIADGLLALCRAYANSAVDAG